MTYPFANLPGNLAAFCGALRRDHGFRIGPRELMDAARGLESVDIADERSVRNALRTVLSKTYDDVAAFDTAFARFFHGATPAAGADSPEARDIAAEARDRSRIGGGETRPSGRGTGDMEELASADHAHNVVRELDGTNDDTPPAFLRASYSPLEGEGGPLVLEPPTRTWLDAATALVRRVQTARSRRWHPAARGPRFDFRRTLRTSLRTAGEAVVPRWRAHPRRRARFVVLIDGSRSMGASALPSLQTAIALSAVASGTETFAFSTLLRRITKDVRRAGAGQRMTLDLKQAWGGGTTIGLCLEDFLRRFAERLLGPDTIVIIASDGLDVGSSDVLRHAMERLARRSAAVVWINPLLQTPGYEPIAVGMSVARPFVRELTAISGAASVRTLARWLSIR